MDLLIINKEKIQQINEGLWTVDRFEFFVEIENDKYYRKFHQKELAAIQTQLIVSNLIKIKKMASEEEEEEERIDEDDENYVYEIFNYHFIKMKKYHKIVEYLNFLGLPKFESIKRLKFDLFEKSFNEDFLCFKKANINIYDNRPEIKFLTDNIQYSAFRAIGEIIQSNEKNDVLNILEPYLKCINGQKNIREIFLRFFEEFMKKQKLDVLFDSFKLGHSFCHFFQQKRIYNLANIQYVRDFDILDSFSQSDFLKKIKASEKNNITFIKVIRPSHCYHCIRSITRTIYNLSHKVLYLNEKTLIFCKKDGDFADRIRDIPKTSVKDTENSNRDLTYFIVHPEMLNEKDHTVLVELLDSRLNSDQEQRLPKIYVISSLDYRTFCYKHIDKFDEFEIQISKDLIAKLCQLSHPDYPEYHCYQLYYSEKAGSGKTYQIIQDFMNHNNCIESEDHFLKSIFVDLNMKKLPTLTNDKNNRTYSYVHLDLSPELFDNNYEFFDSLWTLAVLGYQINSDGTYTNAPKNIFFEVPTLTKNQYPEGGFISESDFPIYCDYYHRISAHKTQKEQIKIPKNVKKICDELFKDKIENTSELLLKATQIFYPKIKFNETSFVPRILKEINIFMEEFCEYLSMEDENTKAIFLLLLRTNFHIWNMDSLFSHEKQPKSFIIMSHQNLFSNERNKNKWILLFFNSIGEENEWDTEYLKYDIGKVNESTFFENKFFKKLLNNLDIEIYSNQTNYDDE